MGETVGLIADAVVSGIMIGGFYAATAVGVSIAFGMLNIVNIAHPAFILLASFLTFIANSKFGIDPMIAGVALMPVFFLLGAAIYEVYERAFERRNSEAIRGLAFFFGLLFITEVALVLVFGVDYRDVQAPYIGPTITLGVIGLPLRLLVPFIAALALLGGLALFLGRTFLGRAIQAVAQDRLALELMAADPVRIKRVAFGISVATAGLAGALLIIIQTIEPSISRDYIGRIFAICVLGGVGSIAGTLIAALTIGVAESLTSTFYGPSWAPAVAFGLLLATLVLRPAGIMGRA